MITISELFPLYTTATKWFGVFTTKVCSQETVRLEKEYTRVNHFDNGWSIWIVDNKIHRRDGPAIMRFGISDYSIWVIDNKWHRKDGPALVDYNKDGSVRVEQWWVNDKQHREDEPSITFFKNGKVVREEYWLDNVKHRTDGPAIIEYNEYGQVIFTQQWIDGRGVYPNLRLKGPTIYFDHTCWEIRRYFERILYRMSDACRE